jgi:hypothetical protein
MIPSALFAFTLLTQSASASQTVLKSNSKIFENVITTPKDANDPAAWDYDWSFSGIRYHPPKAKILTSTFAHLPHAKCLVRPDESFDIAVLGCPFDTAVSYRPGNIPREKLG